MLQIGLSLRFCLVLLFSVLLCSCTAQKPSVQIVKNPVPVIPIVKNCPIDLTHLRQHQAVGYFSNCDPSKDGTAFAQAEPKAQPQATDPYSVWLLVDTQRQQLEVKQGEQTLAVFPNIAIGRNGSGLKKHRGDDITPQGEYRIGWINPQSAFHVFYGLTYPSIEDAKHALSQGLISEMEYSEILYAQEHRQIPPQNTALGGQVGLHGIGQGSEEIHRQMNWTHGCVALTNSQIDELNQWIEPGMRVKIK